ncbi:MULTISPECIES: sensor histidine kinase [Streptosporangium]|uniref:Oxygen sensor histidine kinase NreB n=1 Tax=Streptosporangium brasiliense TaxID=47480 RepID=A0ABT9R1W9_9ACTN|nr:sensor histidine kinase [Streptosporangium brasiliense]MDP9863221.1 signal transduction histidine kinase [Streptosporangium brasiliense]
MRERVWLSRAMHLGFYLLLAASVSRLVSRHGMDARTVAALAVCGLLALVYAAGVVFWGGPGRGRLVWLGTVVAVWLVLVVLAPSFSWCAVPLLFLCLRSLPPRGFLLATAVLTLVVIAAQLKIAQEVDPSLILAPIGVATMIAVIFWELQRESAARQRLIDDLVSTQGTLADSEYRTGVLEERERLAREIHDTLAQGLTSMGLLLQAADRMWAADPDLARAHVRRAALAAADNLDEARRFVRDLQPPGLEGVSLPEALARLCERAGHDTGLEVRFRHEGERRPLAPEVQAALLRVAQGALANVRDHSRAGRAMVTLSYLDDEVTLDVFDDGAGFAEPAPAPGRGYGLRAMRDRLAEVNGSLAVESALGEGTAVAATVPAGRSPAAPRPAGGTRAGDRGAMAPRAGDAAAPRAGDGDVAADGTGGR